LQTQNLNTVAYVYSQSFDEDTIEKKLNNLEKTNCIHKCCWVKLTKHFEISITQTLLAMYRQRSTCLFSNCH